MDGVEITPAGPLLVYKAHLLGDAQPGVVRAGTNASWTLRADMTAQQVGKLLATCVPAATHAYPHPVDGPMREKLVWDIAAGYALRAPHAPPKSRWGGRERPAEFLRRRYRPPV